MAQASLNVFGAEFDFLENLGVGLEADERAIRLAAGFALLFALELALFEGRLDGLAFAEAADKKYLRERVDGFGADAVQADAKLEHVVVILRAGVDLGNAVHDLAEWNSAPEIADGDGLVLDADLDLF